MCFSSSVLVRYRFVLEILNAYCVIAICHSKCIHSRERRVSESARDSLNTIQNEITINMKFKTFPHSKNGQEMYIKNDRHFYTYKKVQQTHKTDLMDVFRYFLNPFFFVA